MVQQAAPPEPEIDPAERRHPLYRAGYIHGFSAAIRDAIEIVEEAEEDCAE